MAPASSPTTALLSPQRDRSTSVTTSVARVCWRGRGKGQAGGGGGGGGGGRLERSDEHHDEYHHLSSNRNVGYIDCCAACKEQGDCTDPTLPQVHTAPGPCLYVGCKESPPVTTST
jgi:hypothetical protein